MSERSDNPENRRKLFFLFALIGIILIAFIAIVFVSSYLGLLNDLNIPVIGAQDKSEIHDSIYNTITSENGITLTSMIKSLDLVVTGKDGARWSASHPGWYVSDARADYADSQGLSQHWTVALRTDSSILVAIINNGQVSDVTVKDLPQDPAMQANEADSDNDAEIIEQYPGNNGTAINPVNLVGKNIFDTGNAMRLALTETGINLPQTSMPFSIIYENNGAMAVYTIIYKDAVTPQRSFVVKMDAVSGHILSSARGVSE
jgi:hypothetical protein